MSEMWPAFQRNNLDNDIDEMTEQYFSAPSSEAINLVRVEDKESEKCSIRFSKPVHDYVLFKLDQSVTKSKVCKRLGKYSRVNQLDK